MSYRFEHSIANTHHYGNHHMNYPSISKTSMRQSSASEEKNIRNGITCESSLSSTPHAPRHRKPVPAATNIDQKTQHPSTHQLIKQHSYLDEGLIKSLSTPGLVAEVAGPNSVDNKRRTLAWEEKQESASIPEPCMVQPYRRTVGHKTPDCVPVLDLSMLNVPDCKMDPVQLIITRASSGSTHRSQISWGHHSNMPTEDLQVQDVLDERSHSSTPTHSTQSSQECCIPQPKVLDSAQYQYVESKVLSHERGCSTTLTDQPVNRIADQPVLFTGGVQPVRPGAADRQTGANLGLGLAVPETSLAKRLRFEARVITQNGRDVHRELCGFLFLVDGSITIYEFRQFGKKLSALPLIQRKVYRHQYGCMKGQVYEIYFIKKGSTLHFRSRDHPGLPSSLSNRPVVAIRITFVDEKAKKLLLTDGLNPVEARKIESYLNTVLAPEQQKEKQLYDTLQGMLCSRLKGRASKTLVGLGRYLSKECVGGIITRIQLEQALRTFHISLTVEDLSELWCLLAASDHCPEQSEEHRPVMYLDNCVTALIGDISEDRMALIRKVFLKLDSHKSGSVEIHQMKKFFAAAQHPDVLNDHRSTEEVWFSLFSSLQSHEQQTSISYSDFEHYYFGVSVETTSDTNFYNLMKNCWRI